jgi:hypothetical protein
MRGRRYHARGLLIVGVPSNDFGGQEPGRLPIALQYPTWRVTIALLIFGLYLNLAVVVGINPLFRYAIYAIPANLLCAYLGAVALVRVLRARYLKQSLSMNS